MSVAIAPPPRLIDAATPVRRLRCVDCHADLELRGVAGTTCKRCGRLYSMRDGLLIAQGELTGKNRITSEFYNSERWQRFRYWEVLFLRAFGGLPGARLQILRHLRHLGPEKGTGPLKSRVPSPFPDAAGSLLEVGIGDGENVALLPWSLHITGIDIAHRPLAACRDRHGDRDLFLALAEGERIPFADRSFDAVLCVGGFNFFSDPARALAEMARVTRRGGRIVVADELPDLYGWGWGHMLGFPQFDDWLMQRFWFGPDFTAMVLDTRLDVAAVARAALGTHRIHSIWRGLGYCIVGSPP